MSATENVNLLRAYAENGDESAFRELVTRYIDLVYSTAVRKVGDPELARDVTQTVFADLARKAHSLRNLDFIGGWLHRPVSSPRLPCGPNNAATLAKRRLPIAHWALRVDILSGPNRGAGKAR